jgi:pimeloyl-ACP methyl ester carboxylesterase
MKMQSIYKSPAGESAVMVFYDSVLARWPIPYETQMIPTRHGNTFVIVCGKVFAPPLVLLHGAGTNSFIWVGDVVEYSQKYRLCLIDLLGEPGKSAPNRPDWGSAAYAEWLEDVLNALEIQKAILLGLSQGGWAAIKFAVYQPERVEKLILLTPAGITPDKVTFVIQALPLMLLGRWGAARITRMIMGDQEVSQEAVEATILIMSNFKTRVGVIPIFTDAELQRLMMPVFLMIGDKDVLRDAKKIVTRMQTLLPQLKAVVVPKGGHALLNTTVPILSFLERSA